MTLFWKTLAAALMVLILVPTLEKQSKDIALVLIAALCCMAGIGTFELLEPVFSFLQELETAACLDSGTLKILLKLVGIGLTGEIVSVICTDTGCGALGKGLQLLTAALILSLSVPIFRSLTELIGEILRGL